MAKGTPWIKIKAEYLQGVTPKELAQKYGLKTKTISDKATKEKWTAEKSQICVNIREKTEDRIKGLTNKAFQALENVLDDDNAEYKDKVSAAKAILDISGLKSSKQELTGKGGGALSISYVPPTKEELEECARFTKEFLNE